jgi:hypothetical protein
MARASEREQEVEKVRVTLVIQVRLEVEAQQEEKTDHITDHTANPSIKIHALLQNQIIKVNHAGNQQTSPIVDVMKDPLVGHQTVPLADQKEAQVAHMKAGHFVIVRRDHQKDPETVHSGDQKDQQEIPVKDPIVVVRKDLQKVQEIVHTTDQKEVQVAHATAGHFVIVRKDQQKAREIDHSRDQKEHPER